MKHLFIFILLSGISKNTVTAQPTLSVSAGLTHSKAKYGQGWDGTFKSSPQLSWAANTTFEFPVTKQLLLHTAIEFANKKFTYAPPESSFFGVKKTERCTYLGFKPSLHFLILKAKHFKLSTGTGIFINTAIGGKYSESGKVLSTPPYTTYNITGDLKIGNTTGNNCKKLDAGYSLQITGRYKNFILPLMADFSFTNNIPNQPSTDPYGMPMATDITRKWRSLYAGIGYLFPLTKRK